MKTHPRRRPNHPRAFTLMELLVVIFITGIFIVSTAPIMQEMLRAFGFINAREVYASTQDAWTTKLRSDLLAGNPITIKTPGSDASPVANITIPAGLPSTAPITWAIDPQNAITRTTAPDATGDTTKTFRPLAQSIAIQKQPGAITIAITQTDIPQPALFTLPLHPGAKP